MQRIEENKNMSVDDSTSLTQEFKQTAFRNHVDLIGVTDLRVVDEIPIRERPMRILSDAKAVVVYGVKYKGASYLFEKSWCNQMDKLLTSIDKKLREFLTEKGYKAHSFLRAGKPRYLYEDLYKRPFIEEPLVQGRWHRVYYKLHDAAVSAGLGRVGKNSLLIIPQYGPNAYLSMIITDAPLEPDAPCDKDPCADCNLCIKACPTGALNGSVHPDRDKCRPMDCHLPCLTVCHEKWLKKRQQLDEQQKST